MGFQVILLIFLFIYTFLQIGSFQNRSSCRISKSVEDNRCLSNDSFHFRSEPRRKTYISIPSNVYNVTFKRECLTWIYFFQFRLCYQIIMEDQKKVSSRATIHYNLVYCTKTVLFVYCKKNAYCVYEECTVQRLYCLYTVKRMRIVCIKNVLYKDCIVCIL